MAGKFIPPTIDEVQAYIVKMNYDLDAESFWYFYDRKDWNVGKDKMKRWRSSVSLWAVNGWGKTNKSTRDFQRRNQAASDYAQKARELYGDWLRSKNRAALVDLLRHPTNQVPVWLIREVLGEK